MSNTSHFPASAWIYSEIKSFWQTPPNMAYEKRHATVLVRISEIREKLHMYTVLHTVRKTCVQVRQVTAAREEEVHQSSILLPFICYYFVEKRRNGIRTQHKCILPTWVSTWNLKSDHSVFSLNLEIIQPNLNQKQHQMATHIGYLRPVWPVLEWINNK